MALLESRARTPRRMWTELNSILGRHKMHICTLSTTANPQISFLSFCTSHIYSTHHKILFSLFFIQFLLQSHRIQFWQAGDIRKHVYFWLSWFNSFSIIWTGAAWNNHTEEASEPRASSKCLMDVSSPWQKGVFYLRWNKNDCFLTQCTVRMTPECFNAILKRWLIKYENII